jgi:uncharacterized protein (DUF433 family)
LRARKSEIDTIGTWKAITHTQITLGVVVRLGRVGGKPTLGESRVPAELIAECLDAGETAEQVADNYDLKVADVLQFKLYRDSNKPAVAQP